jgi:hypothetical protein
VATGDPEIEVLISADGIDWVTSRIPLPQSYRGERVRWGVDTVERLDAGWVAVGRIEGGFDDPVVGGWNIERRFVRLQRYKAIFPGNRVARRNEDLDDLDVFEIPEVWNYDID